MNRRVNSKDVWFINSSFITTDELSRTTVWNNVMSNLVLIMLKFITISDFISDFRLLSVIALVPRLTDGLNRMITLTKQTLWLGGWLLKDQTGFGVLRNIDHINWMIPLTVISLVGLHCLFFCIFFRMPRQRRLFS
jgi:hypothetical protein